MQPAGHQDANDRIARPALSRRIVAGALVFGSFFAYSAVSSPVPGVNEPHYLCKAKHYWYPDWCSGDFFLESSNAHLVFYQTVGLLTRCFTLDQTAWFGRVAALLLFAFAWAELARRLTPGCWSPLWAAWAFLAVAAVGNLSGEWVIGGVESKVIAYALVFWAMALAIDRSWRFAAICAGLAVSLHPIVGLWSLVAVALAGCARKWAEWRQRPKGSPFPFPQGPARPALISLGLLCLCALPGLLPALGLLGADSARISYQANYVQVFFRLKHHLDPMQFPASSYLLYGGLTAFWLVARRYVSRPRGESFFFWFVAAAGIIALAGLVVGLRSGPGETMPFYVLRMKLMRFYPFRLYDILAPLAASMVLVGLVQSWGRRPDSQPATGTARVRRQDWKWAFFAGLMAFALVTAAIGRHPSKMEGRQRADWLDACSWIAAHTPEDAVVVTPRESWGFKWHARRVEYVSIKDCPQDASGIVEWNRRLRYLRTWAEEDYGGCYTYEALARLHMETGVTHIVARHLGPFAMEPVHHNATYRIYRWAP